MHKNHGYTFIELLAVIAIIASLSMLAIPSYRAYMARGKILEVMNATAPIKLAIAEALFDQIPIEDINNKSLKLEDWEPHAESIIDKVQVEQGKIYVQVNPIKIGMVKSLENETNLALHFKPYFKNDLIHWKCLTESNQVDYTKYVPKPCREKL